MGLSLRGTTSGAVDINAPAVAGDNTITLPGNNGAANQFYKNSGTAGTLTHSSMVEDSSGRIGIGTTGSSYPLSINEGSSGNKFLMLQKNSGQELFQVKEDGNDHIILDASHASGELIFNTTGVERMRIDNSGKVGIGTLSPSSNLDVEAATGDATLRIHAAENNSGSEPTLILESSNDFAESVIDFKDSSGTAGGVRYNHGDNALRFLGKGINGEAMRIDSSGRLLVGTSSASGYSSSRMIITGAGTDATGSGNLVLQVGQANGSITADEQIGTINFGDTSGYSYANIIANADLAAGSDSPGRLVFSTTADGASSPTERMRIDNEGRLLVGTTSTVLDHTIQGFGTANCAWFQGNTAASEIIDVYGGTASGNNIFIKFRTDNLLSRGTIDYNRSAGQVRYNTTSDARLKSEIADSTTALNTLNNIRVRKYKWTETDYQVEHGFVAQELTGVVPEAVKVGDDGDEVTDIWAVDNSKLVPLLTKALQEAIAKIETLETQTADLLARVTALEG